MAKITFAWKVPKVTKKTVFGTYQTKMVEIETFFGSEFLVKVKNGRTREPK